MVFRSLFNTFVPRNFLYIIIMEITTYNADGTINETKHIDLQVPEYVKKYDEQNSFLNITAEEVEVVNSRKRTFRKTLLLRRLTAAIKHDYANFRDAYKMEADNLEVDVDVFMQEAESDPQIQSGDRIISSIMRIYGNRSKLHRTEANINEQTFLEQTCTEEEFLIFINKVEHQMADEKGNITSANWIKVIMYHAFKGAGIVRLKYGNVEEEARFYISLQNLINRYYYSLRNMERAAFWMPAELKHQMYVLSAFVKKANMKSVCRFEESRFFIKLINALYLMNEEQRSSLYKMADVVLGYNPTIGFNNQILQSLRTKDLYRHEIKEYEVTLHTFNKEPLCFDIDENEISSLREYSSNDKVEELKSFLKSTYDKYVSVFSHKWKKNILTDANIYFNNQKPYNENWWGFYNYIVEKYRQTSLSTNGYLTPQQCFFFLLCDNVDPDEELEFDKDVIAGLIDLIKDHPCDSQEGLYECMFKINYIKQQVPPRDPIQKSTKRALDYVGWLYTSKCKYVNNIFKSHLRGLLQQMLSVKGLKEIIAETQPNGFTGGFNLELVYNILGLLHSKKPYQRIIARGSSTIDKNINQYAIDNGLIKETLTERKSYIIEFSKAGSENNSLIKPYLKELTDVIARFVKECYSSNEN